MLRVEEPEYRAKMSTGEIVAVATVTASADASAPNSPSASLAGERDSRLKTDDVGRDGDKATMDG